jgi:acyl-CoA synthetase (AMP-forming)/AMP-acid ligase II
VLIPRSTALDLEALAGVLRAERVTVLSLTTTVFNRLLDAHADALAGLKTLLVRGEYVSVPHFRRAAEQLTGTRVIRVYGAAGTSTFSTWQHVDRVAADALTIRAGRPVASSSAYVLDGDLRPVPIKVKGELFVGGDGLALGYLNRPDSTAERFVPNPFAAGERLYRTRDFARWHPDGTLELIAGYDLKATDRGDRFDADVQGSPASAEPETETERQIVSVWREVLGRQRVGIDDDFFEIGGDSIAWVRIVARLRTRAIPLKERDLVSHRTVAALAASIERRAVAAAVPADVAARGAVAAVDEDELVALLGSEGEA